jgi:2,4-diaminopentanoate dehydrogenase
MRSRPSRTVPVALLGLGKLGTSVVEALLDRWDVRIVSAVDLDPARVGRDLGELLGRDPIGVIVDDELPAAREGGVAMIMTGSRMREVRPVIEAMLERGYDVLTSAEELAYPWHEFPEDSRELDELARRHGRRVLGAGANPGFLMDVVPVVLSLSTRELARVSVTRSLDLRPHRAHRLIRFGLGKSPEAFAALTPEEAHGHIGFRQSIDAVADALAWQLDAVDETPLQPAVILSQPRSGEHVTLEAGTVGVVRQTARGVVDGGGGVELCEYFGFIDAADDIPTGDEYAIEGVDQAYSVAVRPGVQSFTTTPAVMTNLLGALTMAEPGLRCVYDFEIWALASKGALRGAAQARSSLDPTTS